MSVNEFNLILVKISTLLDALKDHAEQVVFVGGAVTSLLITEKAAFRVRPTKDIDIIVQNKNRNGFYKFEEDLRSLGFKQKMVADDPICRWYLDEIIVDVVPTSEEILTFGNAWYEIAFRDSIQLPLIDERPFKVISAPMFICTKLNAFDDRGNNDYANSHDMEDIVCVIDGRPELIDEVKRCDPSAKENLKIRFADLLKTDEFIGSLEYQIPFGSIGREQIIIDRMHAIADL